MVYYDNKIQAWVYEDGVYRRVFGSEEEANNYSESGHKAEDIVKNLEEYSQQISQEYYEE